jgi:TM2 domain-containing membrane protein YozV
MFLGMNSENFEMQDLSNMRAVLEKLDDDKFFMLQGAEFQKPSTIFLIALLLGWERFWLDDIAMGIVKIITCYGCFIWWLVDIISAKDRAKQYNMKKFTQITSFI